MYYYERKTLIITVALWLVIFCFYLLRPHTTSYSGSFYIRKPFFRRNKVLQFNGNEEFLINTPGCTIPNYSKNLVFKETSFKKGNCYNRAVFLNKSSEDEVTFHIDYDKIIKKKGQSVKCSYQFVKRSYAYMEEDNRIMYTPAIPFKDGDKAILEEEVMTVSCDLISPKHKKISTYNDAYLILKKKRTDMHKYIFKENVILMKESWNVLIVGLDTMSRGRAYHSLTRTVKYLQEHGWLDYRGYQKVAVNTFPNIMAILSGKNASAAYSSCGHGMDNCESSLVWNKFKKAGYMTAFGEDNLNLPDTFSPYKGFTFPPTDHYARPFFVIGEYRSGNVICTRTKPSAWHLLNYAMQFVEAYKQENFFGTFWVNSLSHNMVNLPSLFEDNLIKFFRSLKNSGALNNTFVFFLSDHGTRFGQNRISRESYYEERLPMLFIRVPNDFQETYPEEYYNLQINQFRFTTPYDVYATLVNIMAKTNKDIDVAPPEACPHCTSLTEEISPRRTCDMANVDQKWCTCHGMFKTNKNDIAAHQSLDLAVKYIINRSRSVKTKKCTLCSPLKLKKVLRNDSYKNGNTTYYVVAFQFTPGDMAFEATVENFGDEFKILHPTDTISQYNIRGRCALNKHEGAYCVCIKDKKCKK